MFVYDGTLSVFRSFIRHGKIWMFVEDWVFWCVAALLVFQMIFDLGDGLIRGFFVFAFVSGMFLYKRLAKDRVTKGTVAVLKFVTRPLVWARIKKITKK